MEARRRISGMIFSDLGRAASFMALDWVQRELREKLGFDPYPATLNLRLESEENIRAWREIRRQLGGIPIPAPDSSFCEARCFRVEIEQRYRGAVIVPEVEDYPANKMEVLAPVRLKDALQVGDGDRIVVEFVD